MELPPLKAIIGLGNSAVVYELDDDTVIKSPAGDTSSVQDLKIEFRIYKRLLGHPRILHFIRVEPRGLVLERLVLSLRQLLCDLHRVGKKPLDPYVLRWAAQIVDGLWYIHSKGVLQADIGCHNLLLDRHNNLKFCDFGGASIDGEEPTVCYQIRSRHPTIQGFNIATEIFALGTTLYEISTGEPPYSQIESATGEIERLYAEGEFPSLEHSILGEIIMKCWRGSYTSTGEIAFELPQIASYYNVESSQDQVESVDSSSSSFSRPC